MEMITVVVYESQEAFVRNYTKYSEGARSFSTWEQDTAQKLIASLIGRREVVLKNFTTRPDSYFWGEHSPKNHDRQGARLAQLEARIAKLECAVALPEEMH